MTVRVQSRGGVALAVTEAGPPDAPAVLMGHGVGSSRRFLIEAFAAPLIDVGWRLVAYDLRGHGDSTPLTDPADHSLAHHVADLAHLCARFRPTVVGGVSLGGHVAVAHALAAEGTVAALACLPAWTGRAVPGQGPHAAVAAEIRRVGLGGMTERMRHDDAMPTWLRDLLLRDWATHEPASLEAALVALDGAAAPSSGELARLATPLAVVSWPDDPGHPDATARLWAEAAPRAGHVATSMAEVGADRAALGRAAVAALHAVGCAPAGRQPAG